MKEFSKRLLKFISSPRFFVGVLVFFVFESVWIGFSAAYPQAFDENFHFGLIQVYSHHWLPFLSGQPPNANAYGAVARDPSYLYHYLMSFPYRVIELFTHKEIRQIIVLRFINIIFVFIALILFKKILKRVGISNALANTIILLFALIPIVPQLSAQINYDNLLLPLVAWTALLTFDLVDQIKKGTPSIKTLLTLFIVCVFASLVKYAFLPIFLGYGLFLIILVFRRYRHNLKSFFTQLWASWVKRSLLVKSLLLVLLVISLGMFMQRDGVNVIRYHSIAPNCSKVLTVGQCSSYSPWEFNYQQHQYIEHQKSSGVNGGPLYYATQWIYWMWYRLFFAVNGPVSSFTNYPPLPLPSAAAIFLFVTGVILFIKYRKKIFSNNDYLTMLFFVSIFYVLVLFIQGYASYHYTDVLENMNGRYLLPVIILFVAVFGKAFSIWLKNSEKIKIVMVCVILALFLQGGGLLTFLSRSDDTWDVQNKTVQKVNDEARKLTGPILIKGQKQYYTSYWFFN